jgi:hypothetical protein
MSLFVPKYFLHVDLLVPESNQKEFENAVSLFQKEDSFHRVDPSNTWKLVFGLRTPDHFTTPLLDPVEDKHLKGIQKRPGRIRDVLRKAHEGSRQVFRYIHLWSIPDSEELNVAELMNACADDFLYMKIDALVAREIQNLVVQMEFPGVDVDIKNVPEPGKGEFVRVIRQFRTKDLGTYVYNVPALLPALAAAKWTTFGHYESATGLLNRFTEFWHTPDGGEESHHRESMAAAFKHAKPDTYLQKAKEIWNEVDALDPAEKRERLVRYI